MVNTSEWLNVMGTIAIVIGIEIILILALVLVILGKHYEGNGQ